MLDTRFFSLEIIGNDLTSFKTLLSQLLEANGFSLFSELFSFGTGLWYYEMNS